jgi:homocitrate synthase
MKRFVSLLLIPFSVLILARLQIKDATMKIKELADVRTQSMDDVDSLLRVYHSGIQSGQLAVGQKEALDRLLKKHREQALMDKSAPIEAN